MYGVSLYIFSWTHFIFASCTIKFKHHLWIKCQTHPLTQVIDLTTLVGRQASALYRILDRNVSMWRTVILWLHRYDVCLARVFVVCTEQFAVTDSLHHFSSLLFPHISQEWVTAHWNVAVLSMLARTCCLSVCLVFCHNIYKLFTINIFTGFYLICALYKAHVY